MQKNTPASAITLISKAKNEKGISFNCIIASCELRNSPAKTAIACFAVQMA
jgi:hypothetical protein